MAPDGETLPRFQNWSVTFQRRLTKNMMLDVSYIGNHGSRLNHNAERAGLDYNMNDPRVLALGATLLNSDINSPAAQAAGILPPYPGFTGNVAQALRKYPQYQSIGWRGLPLGRSQYNAIEVVLEQQFAKGLQYRVGYTYSKLKNNGSESGQGNEGINGGVQDPDQLGHRRLRAERRRHAARVPRRLHVGHRVRELARAGPERRRRFSAAGTSAASPATRAADP